MNAPTTALALPTSLSMDEAELISVLQTSIYPGAKPESIKFAVSYCRAAALDPLQKPVHIVPMDVKSDKKDSDGDFIYEKRDIIMPGIGLYRTQAARTGEYAGISEPEFGPMKALEFTEEKWTGGGDEGRRRKSEVAASIEYPEWCKITVRRLVNGHVAEFTAIEFWTENYATKNRWSQAPNAMWRKRPRGQLAKCAEAQALRKAFPEVGSAPTAEEMEGKTIDVEDADRVQQSLRMPESKSAALTDQRGEQQTIPGVVTQKHTEKVAANAAHASNGHVTASDVAKTPCTAGEIAHLKHKLAESAENGGPTEAECLKTFKLESLEGIDRGTWQRVKQWLRDPTTLPA